MSDREPDSFDPGPSRGADGVTTLEQFREAMTTPVARMNMGIHISDEEARTILSNESLCARYYDAWLYTDRPPAGTPTPVGSAHGGANSEIAEDAVRNLPVQFNRPPGWPHPPPGWVMKHLGRDISTYRRPIGAPPADLAGWVWWIPREPAWTEWVDARTRHYRRALLLLSFGVVAAVGIALVAGGNVAGVTSVLAVVAAIWLVQVTVKYHRFRTDPFSDLRDAHASTIARSSGGGGAAGTGWGGDFDGDGGGGDGD
jgi:hypothetical protein